MRKIGLLIPKTNLTVEHELQYLFNKNILDCNDYVFYASKLDYKTSYKENKEQYLKDLAEDSKSKIAFFRIFGLILSCTIPLRVLELENIFIPLWCSFGNRHI